jgi:hypothetical protein
MKQPNNKIGTDDRKSETVEVSDYANVRVPGRPCYRSGFEVENRGPLYDTGQGAPQSADN